jgi:DNA polymerase (family 10)
LKYIVIADHSASLGIANGLSVERLRKQATEIQALDIEFGPQFRILHGTEMEIRANGELDFPDEILASLDFVIASLHVGLRQSRKQIMERLLGAVQNPHVDMIAHPTGRLIPDRPGADVDMEHLIQTAANTGTILEINANPQRLDLQANDVRRAVEIGAKVAINTDAHHADHFRFMHFGVATAQRGWASAGDVVNTWTASKLMVFVENKP